MVDINKWLDEAKRAPGAEQCGMYLTHNGVVRATAKAMVREGKDANPVAGMVFSYDNDMINEAVAKTKEMTGIYYVRVELESGELNVGDDIMYVLIGGDTRPHTLAAFNFIMDEIKGNCVKEIEVQGE
ncbi:MAG: molybdenum cofactor biosynthesis protein MoaE [Oscillospiraceae bacterium]|nr:molybdenum cofactor biosynthesis protein MoaE [Candidatus Limimonas coprohippi]